MFERLLRKQKTFLFGNEFKAKSMVEDFAKP
ncbi:MAG: hypothetical protein JWP13_578 [Candidatus Saccharibacteria bacterium]|nr:hypothetical protein [Candidatus Saccharibacteria bacterium]